MVTPSKYANNFLPIKYMLASYRALSDGKVGIAHLENMLANSDYLFSEWKIIWTGTCSTLRTAIDLFQRDARMCLSDSIGSEIKNEWNSIKQNADEHPIFWEFLRKERNNIAHEYAWTAYEAWLEPDGTVQSPPTILGRLMSESEARPKIMMKAGRYEGADSVELLHEAADWVQNRIFGAVERAGYNPDEKRGIYDFRKMPDKHSQAVGLLAAYADQIG